MCHYVITYLGKGYERTGKSGEIGEMDGQMDGIILSMYKNCTFLEKKRPSSFQKYIVFYAYHKAIQRAVIRICYILPVHVC